MRPDFSLGVTSILGKMGSSLRLSIKADPDPEGSGRTVPDQERDVPVTHWAV